MQDEQPQHSQDDSRVYHRMPKRTKQIGVWLSPSLLERLALYQAETYEGRLWLRSMIVEEVLSDFLKSKGY